jgi:nucleotide-binding universal stress UspA family protein
MGEEGAISINIAVIQYIHVYDLYGQSIYAVRLRATRRVKLYRKILVAIDGSEPSKRALDYAVEIAETRKSELIIVTSVPRAHVAAFPVGGFNPLYMDQYEEDLHHTYSRILAEETETVKKQHPDLLVNKMLLEGRAGDAVVEASKEDGIDLIVMGCRGLSGIKGFVLGSVSRHVVENCTKPILVVK